MQLNNLVVRVSIKTHSLNLTSIDIDTIENIIVDLLAIKSILYFDASNIAQKREHDKSKTSKKNTKQIYEASTSISTRYLLYNDDEDRRWGFPLTPPNFGVVRGTSQFSGPPASTLLKTTVSPQPKIKYSYRIDRQ